MAAGHFELVHLPSTDLEALAATSLRTGYACDLKPIGPNPARALTRFLRRILGGPSEKRVVHAGRLKAHRKQELEVEASERKLSPLACLRRFLQLRCRALLYLLSPKGPGCNDNHLAEKVTNIVTCLPLVVVGCCTLRSRTSVNGRAFGASFIALGAVATLYHASVGRIRPAMRKLDYYTLCCSTFMLRRAAGVHFSVIPAALSAFAVPFRPTLATALNLLGFEVEFFSKARLNTAVRDAFLQHAAIGGSGLLCFKLEDLAHNANFHYVHSLWHLLAAGGLAKTNVLLQYKEQLL